MNIALHLAVRGSDGRGQPTLKSRRPAEKSTFSQRDPKADDRCEEDAPPSTIG
jgi:hypothetical protein